MPEAATNDFEQEQDDRNIVFTPEQWESFLQQQRDEAEANRRQFERILRPQPAPGGQNPALPQVDINIDGLPDPAYDRDGFLKGLGERMTGTVRQIENRVVTQANHTVQRQAAFNEAYNTAWSAAQKDHPELSRNKKLTEALVRQWSEQQQREGRDPVALLMSDPEGVGAEVGNYAAEQLAFLRDEGSDGDTSPRPRAASRTEGIVGSRPRGVAKPQKAEKITTMIDELKDFQSRARIY